MGIKIKWLDDVEDKDFEAAHVYLSLLMSPRRADKAVVALRASELITRRPNDILRACHRDPLPHHDTGVSRALAKIHNREPLSPVLVVSFDFGGDVADGYHRVSAAYHLDPFVEIPLRLAHVPDLR